MHRSGTSLVTRLLNVIGLDLGPPDGLIPPSPDNNPAGFWEHAGIVALNDEILRRLGASWHSPPSPVPGWELRPDIAELSAPAREMLARDFPQGRAWGFKDPRLSLILPFWQRLLSPRRYVLCVRRPIDVARSLALRDGFPLERGLDLWLTYMTSALAHVDGAALAIVRYEDVMDDGWRVVEGLARFAGLERGLEAAGMGESLRSVVAADLRHHHTTTDEAEGDDRLPLPALALDARLTTTTFGPGVGDGVRFRRLAQFAARCGEAGRAAREAAVERRSLVARVVAAEHLARLQAESLDAITGSVAYRVMSTAWRLHRRLAPAGTTRGRWADALIRRLRR
jgi:hypothetical protein